jgi:hypothetical protein
VFCPNCGTQNPDTAEACSKCKFHLKSAAAPKFKGTMLMMNQPGALPPAVPPAVPAVPARSGPGAAPPPGAGLMPSKLKGTLVGVAPMVGVGAGLPPAAPTPTRPQFPGLAQGNVPGGTPAGSAQDQPPTGEGASAFAPPVPQPGVNPLGGTVAADAGLFGALAAQQEVAAGGPVPPAYGAPPSPGDAAPAMQGPGGTVAMAAPYGYGGQSPQGPTPFAVPPPPGGAYGQPAPQPGGGPMGQGMVPYGSQQPGPMVGTLKSSGPTAVKPTRRNALLTFLLPGAVIFGGIVMTILGFFVQALGTLGSLCILGGAVWYLLIAIQMINELKSVTRNEALAWWPLVIPFYGMYWAWLVVPQEAAKAKQMLGVRQAPQPLVLYIFLWHFALASDLNDMVR